MKISESGRKELYESIAARLREVALLMGEGYRVNVFILPAVVDGEGPPAMIAMQSSPVEVMAALVCIVEGRTDGAQKYNSETGVWGEEL